MNDCKTEELLERIAIALESIDKKIGGAAYSHILHHYSSHYDSHISHDSKNHIEQGITEDFSVTVHDRVLDNTIEGNKIVDYLAKKGITVKNVPTVTPADKIIDQLSEFIGKNYEAIYPIMKRIKQNMQRGDYFTESIKSYQQNEIATICHFCTMLKNIAFLEQYTYRRSPAYIIQAKTSNMPKAQMFFSGQWLERYALNTVKRLIGEISVELDTTLDVEYLVNPQVILPNGNLFEFDVMFMINEKIFWIEAKSGDYQTHIAKYSKLVRQLGIDSDRAFLLLADVDDNVCRNLKNLYDMMICNLQDLKVYVRESILQNIGKF